MAGLFLLNISSVSALLKIRSPAAVTRSVVAIIVNALNSKPRRALTHVSQKVSERAPALTDCNSTPTIVFEARIIGICSSLKYLLPRPVSARMTKTMFAVRCAGSFFMQTSTRLRRPATHTGAFCYFLVPAVAQKSPSPAALVIKCNKSPKSLTGKVDGFWHSPPFCSRRRPA